jgi:hypothetical protein
MNLPPCPRCPNAGETDVGYTVKRQNGSYCRCAPWGYVWHVDAVENKTSEHSSRHPQPNDT